MEELIAQIQDTARGIWRCRWIGLLVAWLVAGLAVIVLMRMPDRYEATARIYVDTKSVLKPLMRDLTVDPDLEQTVALLARTIITRPNIELLMRKTQLDARTTSQLERDELADVLMREIKLTSGGRDNIFTFSYRNSDPVMAKAVVQHLVSIFRDTDAGTKQRDAEEARSFIDEQIKNHEARLAEAENRRKEFKLRNLAVMDSGGRDYFSRISALTEEYQKLTLDLRANEQARDSLKRELEGENSSLVPDVPNPALSALTPEIDARLDTQRKQLDELLRRYTDLHPDVVAARRLIERLEEQKKQELEARRRAREADPKRSVNQGQQQIRLALAAAEASVSSIKVRVADINSRLEQLRSSASKVPQVEAELAQLNRDYDVVRRNYDELVARREKASLSEDIDSTRQAQFRLIDPPRTSAQPVFPNRRALAPLAIVVALVAGVLASFLSSQLSPTFDNARTLRLFSQRPVLGSISMVLSDTLSAQARRRNIGFALAVVALLTAHAGWIAWLSMQSRV